MVRPLIVVGTRPEAIKMAPVIQAAAARAETRPIVCATGQHRELIEGIWTYFGILPDIELDVMSPGQSLVELTSRLLTGLNRVVDQQRPDCLVAQGDTSSVLAASMVAFFQRIPFVHVEAGLRTGNLWAPWPEEYNRRVAGMTADLHCAPTQRAANHLLAEGVSADKIYVTGNTVVDALRETVRRESGERSTWASKYADLGDSPLVLVTGHRRENFGEPFERVCRAIRAVAEAFPTHKFVYPVHLNPQVRQPVQHILGNVPNITLTPPAIYPEFVWLLHRSRLIITDSGGVQEEAVSLGRRVLVTREATERPEGVEVGLATLVGTDPRTLEAAAAEALRESNSEVVIGENPYGDGRAAERIVELMHRFWGHGTAVAA